jgi:hypothetical protein
MDRYYIYRLASTLEERIRSNAVIRGATVWRHLPAANPYLYHNCSKVESKTLHRRRGRCRHSLGVQLEESGSSWLRVSHIAGFVILSGFRLLLDYSLSLC